MQAQLHKTRSFPLVWIVSLFLLLGLGTPSFFNSPVGFHRIPVQTEQKDNLKSSSSRAFSLTINLPTRYFPCLAESFAGLINFHSRTSSLSYHESKLHLLSLPVKLGAHPKTTEYTGDVSLPTAG
jgi:hypothetical protein